MIAAVVDRYLDTGFYLVVCGWFAGECDSSGASELFRRYDVYASPSLLFLRNEGEDVRIIEMISGVLELQQLLILYEIIRAVAFES